MIKSKWLKMGAVAFLSMNVLVACDEPGVPEEEDIPEIDEDEEVEEVEEDTEAE